MSTLLRHKVVIALLNLALDFVSLFKRSLWHQKQRHRPAPPANQAKQCQLQTRLLQNWEGFQLSIYVFENMIQKMK